MGGIVQNPTRPTGLATSGDLNASPQNKEPACFFFLDQMVLAADCLAFFSALYLEVCFDRASCIKGLF